MKKRICTILLAILSLALLTSCGGGGERSVGVGASAPSLVAIEVTPADPVIALGTELRLKATGIYSDNSKKDLTETIEWYSSDDTVVTVSRGLARSVARGSAVIGVQSGKVAGNRPLTVTDASLVSIQVTPVNPEAPLGTTRQFTATGVFSDESVQDLTEQVSWSAADGAVASVSNEAGSRGLATPAGIGSTAVSATLEGVTGSTDLTVTEAALVSIQITPANPSLAKGTTLQLTATGAYTDGSTQNITKQATWNVSDPSVASVSNAAGTNGLATALAVGSATVSATLGTVTGTTTLEVTAAALVSIEVDPVDAVISIDLSQEFTAVGIYSDSTVQDLTQQVTWSASDPRVASVSNAVDSGGLATPVGIGSTVVSAALGGLWGSTTLTVSNASLVSVAVTPDGRSIRSGENLQFKALGHYSDGMTMDITRSAVWKSSDNKVAKVSNARRERGFTTGGEAGNATITATLSKISGTAALAVE